MTRIKRLSAQEVLGYLSDSWQTASMIAAQIPFRPDSVSRELTRPRGRACTVQAAKTNLASDALGKLFLRGAISRRVNESTKKFEYKLNP